MRKGEKEAVKESEVIEKILPVLEAGKLARSVVLNDEEKIIAKQLQLLSMKPILYVLNVKGGDTKIPNELLEFFQKENAPFIVFDIRTEHELGEMSPEEQKEFRKDLGVAEEGLRTLIKKGYEMLDLITFLTTGEDETRGWTVKRNSIAPIAGMAIHTDFREKFIRAEVVFWKDLIDAGSYPKAREKGLVRTEGKDYIVKDGDVIEFKI